MGVLDGDITALFGSVFGEFYLDGTITTISYSDDGMGGGSPTSTTQNVKLQVDACTERQKLEEGYTARDVRVIALQSGMTGRPNPGDRVTAKSVTYVIGPVITEDPASSYYEMRGRPL